MKLSKSYSITLFRHTEQQASRMAFLECYLLWIPAAIRFLWTWGSATARAPPGSPGSLTGMESRRFENTTLSTIAEVEAPCVAIIQRHSVAFLQTGPQQYGGKVSQRIRYVVFYN